MMELVKSIQLTNEKVIECPILPNGTGWQSSEEMGLSVMETGKKRLLLNRMREAVLNAQDFICLQSFLIEDGDLIEALVKVQERGIRIFMLNSADARLKDDSSEEESEIDRQTREAYIQLLEERFKYRFLLRSAPYFHAKYLLIDPKSHPRGFLCTNNFTQKAFQDNVELAIELTAEQVQELFRVFVYHFWEHAKDEHTERREFDKVTPTGRFEPPQLAHILLTSPEPTLCSLGPSLLEAVQKAKRSISISTFSLDREHELIKTLRKKAREGVEVTLFTRPKEGYFQNQLRDLLRDDIKIFLQPGTHAKSLLVDQSEGYIFTANLGAEGLDRGMEVGVRLSLRQTEALVRIHDQWRQTFRYVAIDRIAAREVQSYFYFKNGKLEEIKLQDKQKKITREVKTVADLIDFFGQKLSLRPDEERFLEVQLIAQIETVPAHWKIDGGGSKFRVVEIEEPAQEIKEKGKEKPEKTDEPDKRPVRRQFMVLYDDFQVEDIPALDREEWKKLRVYRC